MWLACDPPRCCQRTEDEGEAFEDSGLASSESKEVKPVVIIGDNSKELHAGDRRGSQLAAARDALALSRSLAVDREASWDTSTAPEKARWHSWPHGAPVRLGVSPHHSWTGRFGRMPSPQPPREDQDLEIFLEDSLEGTEDLEIAERDETEACSAPPSRWRINAPVSTAIAPPATGKATAPAITTGRPAVPSKVGKAMERVLPSYGRPQAMISVSQRVGPASGDCQCPSWSIPEAKTTEPAAEKGLAEGTADRPFLQPEPQQAASLAWLQPDEGRKPGGPVLPKEASLACLLPNEGRQSDGPVLPEERQSVRRESRDGAQSESREAQMRLVVATANALASEPSELPARRDKDAAEACGKPERHAASQIPGVNAVLEEIDRWRMANPEASPRSVEALSSAISDRMLLLLGRNEPCRLRAPSPARIFRSEPIVASATPREEDEGIGESDATALPGEKPDAAVKGPSADPIDYSQGVPSASAARAATQGLVLPPDGLIAGVPETQVEYTPGEKPGPHCDATDAVPESGLALQSASQPQMQDVRLRTITEDIDNNGLALQFADNSLKADFDTVLAAVKNNGMALGFASSDLQSDSRIVLAAVEHNGLSLQHASLELRQKRKIVELAIEKDPLAIQYVPKQWRCYQELLLRTVALRPEILSSLPRDTAFDALAEDGELLGCAGELRNDKEAVLLAVVQSGVALRFASDELRGNREIALAACEQDGFALEFASDALRNDSDLVCKACLQNSHALKYAGAAAKKSDRLWKGLAKLSATRTTQNPGSGKVVGLDYADPSVQDYQADSEEKRIGREDPDRMPYTFAEFLEFYGEEVGLKEWNHAEIA